MKLDAIAVFIFFFLLVTVLGFVAARWRRGDLDLLHEWGLGGRRFGTVITWFLLGGDLYTAYTFIAIPTALPTQCFEVQRVHLSCLEVCPSLS